MTSGSSRRCAGWLAGRALLLLLAACSGRDAGVERYAQASARYQTLLAERRAPSDPAFDQVLAELAQIPVGSSRAEAGRRLAQAIAAARAPRAVAPLATPSPRRPDEPEVAAHEADCARLARELGVSQGAERARLAADLEACRRAVSEKREASHEAKVP